MIIVNEEKGLAYNKKLFFIISILQIVIAMLPLIVVLASTKSGEWYGEWHGKTLAVSIFHNMLYSRIKTVFIVFLLFTLFNPVYYKSSIVALISIITTYIFSAAFYGPRYASLISFVHSINKSLWILISFILIGISLAFIVMTYLNVINKNNDTQECTEDIL